MTTSDELIAVLEKEPSNFDLYCITADCLEEEGKWELARAYRWRGENGKYPLLCSSGLRLFMLTWEQEGCNEKPQHRLPFLRPYDDEENVFDWFMNIFSGQSSFTSVMQALADHFDTVVNFPSLSIPSPVS